MVVSFSTTKLALNFEDMRTNYTSDFFKYFVYAGNIGTQDFVFTSGVASGFDPPLIEIYFLHQCFLLFLQYFLFGFYKKKMTECNLKSLEWRHSFRLFQGAERKTRDEERRAAKRKMTATGRKKLDELYHPMCERSEFYSMSDLSKPPVLFSPAEDIDKVCYYLGI